MPEDSRIQCRRIDPETFELVFAKAVAEDSGHWAVIAKNPHGEMSQFFNLSAQMLPRFEIKLQDLEANEGKQVGVTSVGMTDALFKKGAHSLK